MGTHYRGGPAEVRALDLLIKLSRSASALSDRLEEPLREQGFSASQFGLLEALLHLGPLEPCELGPKLLTSRPNVVLLVDQLERRGLVRRVPVAHDRRRILVELTAKGRRAIEETLASLRATGPEASASHAQLAAEHRRRAEQLFIREEAA